MSWKSKVSVKFYCENLSYMFSGHGGTVSKKKYFFLLVVITGILLVICEVEFWVRGYGWLKFLTNLAHTFTGFNSKIQLANV